MAIIVPHWSSNKAMSPFVWACAWLECPGVASDWYGGAIHVNAGESTQAAINAAHPGQLILVAAGTPGRSRYRSWYLCAGQNVQLAEFVVEHRRVISVGRPVQDVVVTGFEVRGFSGLNIAVVGGQDVHVKGNTLYDGAQYGCLTVGSTSSHIESNTVASSCAMGDDLLFIAICMHDPSDLHVTKNHVADYSVGLCVQTDGADVSSNDVTNADGNPLCASVPGGALIGIALLGAFDQVHANLVEGLTTGGTNGSAVGIAILNDPVTGLESANNTVTGNVLRGNDVDIFVDTPGQGVEGNQCSTPAELCS
ncbi:hypothetical protein FOPE_06971 [Fonsecaea pedrosoi]|nr:hypothetical protein FOPE_06971 [Fonsecaea pedrosoi]